MESVQFDWHAPLVSEALVDISLSESLREEHLFFLRQKGSWTWQQRVDVFDSSQALVATLLWRLRAQKHQGLLNNAVQNNP